MNASELGLTMIYNILTLSQRKINNVHTINLSNFLITFTTIDVFCYQFGCTEKHSLEIGIFIVVLYFNQNQFTL